MCASEHRKLETQVFIVLDKINLLRLLKMWGTLILLVAVVPSSTAVCRTGYRLNDNGTCVDINECEQWGVCSQRCINKPGTFVCECVKGYEFQVGSYTQCEAVGRNSSSTLLLAATATGIVLINTGNNGSISTLADGPCFALDFVWNTSSIIWSFEGEDIRITRTEIGGGRVSLPVIQRDFYSSIEGISVDWIHQNVYWTDSGKETIEVMSLESKYRTRIVEEDLHSPRGIAVNPLDGCMFWTDWGSTPGRIERAAMDGSERQKIIESGLVWPNGLTIDFTLERIFWVDASTDTMESSKYDGSDRRVIMRENAALQDPFSVNVFGNYLYYSDRSLHGIYQVDKFTGDGPSKVFAYSSEVFTVVVYHQLRQPEGKNRCAGLKGCCEHLCVPRPSLHFTPYRQHGVACACPGRNSFQVEAITEPPSTTDVYLTAPMKTSENPDRISTTTIQTATSLESTEINTATLSTSTEDANEAAETTWSSNQNASATFDQEARVCDTSDASWKFLAITSTTIAAILCLILIFVSLVAFRFASLLQWHNLCVINPVYENGSEEFPLSTCVAK